MSDAQTIPSFGAMLRVALGDALAADAGEDFLAMCDDDIVFQFPFAPPGTVTEVRGKVRMAAYLPKVGALLAFESMGTPITHAAMDGETFVLEFSCKGSGSETGARYDQNYISVIRVRDGRIVHYRDYWNPLILLEAVGGIETLTSNFQEFIDG
ncbi:nuclear transport factor 2 family protein [Hoeflea poritis]|uniref:Nuclear transport factor 2 family protein n=1 Tax=Hoeflea poritis TaxID=2993659 RepID=A0ABT4VWI9_9HYPH|nr:nuclear transport factor 2 family protein [Hoeflea poritis]MDA4848580.1 nuclear transport factor 2 family protein [Hoeflea poritis]